MGTKRAAISGLAVSVLLIIVVLSALDISVRAGLLGPESFSAALDVFRTSVPIWFIPAYWVGVSVIFSAFFYRGGKGGVRVTAYGAVSGALLAYFLVEWFGLDRALGYDNKAVVYAAIIIATVIFWRYAQMPAYRSVSRS